MDGKLLHLCSPGRKEAHNLQAAGKKTVILKPPRPCI